MGDGLPDPYIPPDGPYTLAMVEQSGLSWRQVHYGRPSLLAIIPIDRVEDLLDGEARKNFTSFMSAKALTPCYVRSNARSVGRPESARALLVIRNS